ncbi:MAG: N-acetylmuramoyl-L-alanine amidase [Armatimonadetes bacterium]|nr:N-acetylmuramoyl-L-alanine amidase [Armatimonadota bacterium]
MLATLILTVALGDALLSSPPQKAPSILARAEWGAKPPIAPWREHIPSRITIHHAGVPTDLTRTLPQKLRALQAFSQRQDKLAGGKDKPPWPDIPYHWYIGRDGTIAECRDPKLAGDTNTEYDPTGHLLICLEGNLEEEEPSGAQIRSLDAMVVHLAAKYHVPPSKVGAHKDFAQTTCPGKNLTPEIAKVRARLELRALSSGRS